MDQVSFDNIWLAMLVIFQSITLEGWTDIMYLLNDTILDAISVAFFVGVTVLGALFIRAHRCAIFTCGAAFIGGLFMTNLALAVISSSYEKCQEEEEERQSKEKENRLQEDEKNDRLLLESAAVDVSHGGLVLGSMVQHEKYGRGAVKELQPVPDPGVAPYVAVQFLARRALENFAIDYDEINDVYRSNELQLDSSTPKPLQPIVPESIIPTPAEPGAICRGCRELVEKKAFSHFVMLCIVLNTVMLALEHHNQPTFEHNYLALMDDRCADLFPSRAFFSRRHVGACQWL